MAFENGQEDVIALLKRQHEEIRALFDEVGKAKGDRRKEAFNRLVRLMSVHETSEEEVVHPEVRRMRGNSAVAARLDEEHSAKRLLATLVRLGPDTEAFDPLFTQLRDDVLAHAEHEEREEFPVLREKYDERRLRTMATAVRAAQAIAPTRPHPGIEGAAANLIFGAPLALMDRARDAVRTVLTR
jgi:hemerythrin superfamily protein